MSGHVDIPAETPLLSASKLVSSALSKLQQGQSTDPSALKQLQLALSILTSLDPYLDTHSSPASPALSSLLKATLEEDWTARHKEGKTTFPMAAGWSAGAYEGNFVAHVARSIGAKRVLEVGMFTGTTTLAVVERLPPAKEGGKIVALELDAWLGDFVKPHFERAGCADKFELVTGPAKQSLDELTKRGEEPFDLVFIDADKTGYEGYFKQIMDGGLLRKGGVFLVDNTLYKGAPLLSKQSDRKDLYGSVDGIAEDNAEALVRFNDIVAKDDRCEVTLLPVRDGLTWINRVA
ncbi:S-adenosyl-L-methionine-dependent methyltransferase [Jaminaea rosea]|uniref:S-adenosyl-L-methionine-dependent methyltransferase n=1 Tax=Jaminaea rosea TaxID=1569628 RepID=A0A316UUX3_9BASI|nr:S-adenosyl-L-methionine-dependent methyltransferase [Jaminaea rosea]PWN29110.1 S-adenosyl-L-methionine-dependent methyltransferase [Jaminaea rosea]